MPRISLAGKDSSASRHSLPAISTVLSSSFWLWFNTSPRWWWLSIPAVAPSLTTASTASSVSGRFSARMPTVRPGRTPWLLSTAAYRLTQRLAWP